MTAIETSEISDKNDEAAIAKMALDLVLYREGVETLMRLRSAELIANSEPAHAAILFEVFFRNAEDHVRIFCEQLSKRVFGSPSMVEAAKALFKRGKSISVIYQKDQPEESDFLTELRSANSVVMAAPKEAAALTYNFAVMDSRSYRVEHNRKDCVARATMFDPEKAQALVRRFDQYLIMKKIEDLCSKLGEVETAPAAVV